jgi:transcriptional regulator with XRE-family HTH domain
MRRASLTPEQAQKLGQFLSARRTALGLSMRELARHIGNSMSTISVIEAGTNLNPMPDTLKAIARALDVPVSDVYVAADLLPAGELPTLKPYLRAKYHDLDESAIAELERYADQLAKRHGGLGPVGREDEQP